VDDVQEDGERSRIIIREWNLHHSHLGQQTTFHEMAIEHRFKDARGEGHVLGRDKCAHLVRNFWARLKVNAAIIVRSAEANNVSISQLRTLF